MRVIAGQLAGAWIAGSLLLGTVAVLLTSDPGMLLPFTPLDALSAGSLLLVLALVAVLFLVLFVLYWRTASASWLPDGGRPAVLWSVLVGGGGLVGWGFAAMVTFAAEFPMEAQLALAFVGGGLPFALIAGLLARPVLVNAVAVSVTVAALGIGYALAEGNDLGLTPLQLCTVYLRLLVGPSF